MDSVEKRQKITKVFSFFLRLIGIKSNFSAYNNSVRELKEMDYMRTELAKYHNQYIEVVAEFMRIAITGGKVNILFRNVMHEGEEITNHIWIKMQDVRNSKQINEIKLKKHGIYKIRGKVYTYKKFSKEANKMVYDYCLKSVRIAEV